MIFHVSINGCDSWNGTEDKPFRSINKAASLAMPGDTVKVHAGVYREWVNPVNGGTEDHRIVYESAGDGEVVITGAEPVSDWKDEGDGVWSTKVPNTLFTYRNPFDTLVYGDWLFAELPPCHLGQVYLDGKSMYERPTLDAVKKPEPWATAKYPEQSLLAWHSEVDGTFTTIWANFGGKDPRKENVEINVRPFCFWPEKTGRNYITVRGFTLTQASPQWAPPTALQEGLIGPHWSKGWIIENNKISEASCCGISLGKDISTGHNEWSDLKFKFGTQREQEVIFRAQHGNWNKDNIGSHIVRYNDISECDQCGIVGHLGSVFSEIYGNTIHHIHHKMVFHGAEVAAIKLHASLDVDIHHNVFYSDYRAVWFDWQAQGTHLHHNVCFDSKSEDLFIEVCHGPYMVDHNLFLSLMNFRNVSQGGAFVHNLFAGHIVINPDRGRMTPYHFPHETAVAGYTNIIGGDDRFIQNVFLRDADMNDEPVPMGFFDHLPLPKRSAEDIEKEKQAQMDGLPTKNNANLLPVGLRAYDGYPGPDNKFWEMGGNYRRMMDAHLPSTIKANLYLNNARPSDIDEGSVAKEETGIEIIADAPNGKVTLKIDPKALRGVNTAVITSNTLGKSYHAEQRWEESDGTDYILDRDFFGNPRPAVNVMPGPFELTGDEVVTIEL